MYGEPDTERLVGKKITHIFASKDYLRFETDTGEKITFAVEGDCCSRSVFYDFIGVKKLLENGPVLSTKQINLDTSDIVTIKGEYSDGQKDKNGEHEAIAVYGFEIVTSSPEFGDMTSVFSFRNYSNGYYGGSLENSEYEGDLPELTDDTTHIE